MDALKGIGHACGHNLIAIAGVAVACALKRAMEEFDIPGTVELLGTPGMCSRSSKRVRIDDLSLAEEFLSGKVKLLELGAYKNMDVCFMLVSIRCDPFRGLKNLLDRCH